MKLYATTTSERASKGQGGNKFLNIEILGGGRSNPLKLAEITVDIEEKETETIFRLWNFGNEIDRITTDKQGNEI